MKTARLHAQGDIRLHDEPIPAPGPGEALVRVGAVGICGSDLHWFSEGGIGDSGLVHPLVLGHELAGWTESGQLVAVDPCIPCGVCQYCREGNPNLCPNQRFAGHSTVDGGLREWIAWPEENLIPLPDGFTPADGAMLEPLGVALYALDLSPIRPGDAVGVFGSGPIGQLLIQLVRLAGAGEVIATDVLPHRVEAARKSGAHRAILAEDRRGADQVLQAAPKGGLDAVFEVAGDNAAVEAAVETVKPGGRVTLVGIPGDDSTTLRASVVRRKGLALQWVRRMKHTYPRAVQLVQREQIDVRTVVTQAFPIDQVRDAFTAAGKRDGLKVVVTFP